MHSVDDLIVCFGDLNGHVGRHVDVFHCVYEGYGIGQGYLEGECY